MWLHSSLQNTKGTRGQSIGWEWGRGSTFTYGAYIILSNAWDLFLVFLYWADGESMVMGGTSLRRYTQSLEMSVADKKKWGWVVFSETILNIWIHYVAWAIWKKQNSLACLKLKTIMWGQNRENDNTDGYRSQFKKGVHASTIVNTNLGS